MKTIRLEGRALDLARELSFIAKEGEKRVKQMEADLNDVQKVITKELSAKMKELLETVGVDKDKRGSVDGTYLEEHGLAFLQFHEQPSLSDLLESVVAASVEQPQETAQ